MRMRFESVVFTPNACAYIHLVNIGYMVGAYSDDPSLAQHRVNAVMMLVTAVTAGYGEYLVGWKY
jgi:hypothetical protein